jgi:hypothetical protein
VAALTKRQVEVLLLAIDTDALVDALRAAAQWVLELNNTELETDPIAEVARRLGWSSTRLADLARREPQTLAEMATELAERRQVP